MMKSGGPKVKTILAIEGSINLLISAGKFTVGIHTNSSAIIADAVHSLTDIANNVVAWFAANLSQEKPDERHPYGHQKFETLAIFFIASVLFVLAIEVALHAIERFGAPVKQSTFGLIILSITLVINVILSYWEAYWSKRLASPLLKADASHTFSDALTTLVVLLGWQLASMGYYWVDMVLALLVSVMIAFLAVRLFMRVIPVLVDENHLNVSDVKPLVEGIDGVIRLKRWRSRFDGKSVVADLTVLVTPSLSTIESHKVADEIEQKLASQFGALDVMIHIEPDA